MGKQMNGKSVKMTIPPLEELPETIISPVDASEEPTDLEVPTKMVSSVSVSVPLASVSGYVSGHVAIRFAPGESHLAETLKRLHEGLYQSSAKMASGKHITSTADAVRWMLEQVALASATK